MQLVRILLLLLLVFPVTIHAQKKRISVLIDAGHGGVKSGAAGKISLEKNIALKVALKLGKMIEEQLPNIKVIQTRKTDVDVDWYRRAEIANDNKADLFISIHCNSMPKGNNSTKGTETFVGAYRRINEMDSGLKENEEILKDKNCYNIKEGGTGGGGFNNKEHQLKCSQAAGKKHSYRMKNDEEYRKNISEKLSKSNKRRYENGDLKLFLEQGKNSFKGKKHSEESKKKISDNKKNKYTGSENSQFNTCWITKSQVNKKIKKDEFNLYEKDGWTIGRYQPYRGELSGSNKLKEVDVIEIKKLISENNLTTEKISKRFNVARQTIDKIKRGLTWSHIK